MTSTTPRAQDAPLAPLAWAARLRERGLRVTRQRLAVLDALQRHPHTRAEDVLQEVRTELPEITVQSVYTVLNSLTAAGLLRRLDLTGQPARYETQAAGQSDNHHHAVCTHCGRIEDVPCAVGHAPCLTPSVDHGMAIQVADVVYQGVCADCRTGSGTSHSASAVHG